MKCPDCFRSLPDIATACRCGWTKSGDLCRPFIQCAHEGCATSAIVKIHTATGWAKLCLPHYEAHYAREARHAMDRYGLKRGDLESSEDYAKRVRQKWKDLAARSSMSRGEW